jgi:ubiquinone/menaquinone biosynthesis C-methylase UbiE
MRAVLKGNYLAPIQNPQMILDIGSGTGIWGYDMAREFPQAHIYGLDLEAVEKADAPSNTHFVRGNVLQGLPFQPNQFDFVHQRLLIGALPATAWPVELQQIFQIVRPGGWVELVESSGGYNEPHSPANMEMADGIVKIAALRGIDTHITLKLDTLLGQAGFTHIEKKIFQIPTGQWGDRLGSLMATDWQAIIRTFQKGFISVLGYSPTRFEQLFNEMVKEWEQYHSTSPFYVLYGQKPLR